MVRVSEKEEVSFFGCFVLPEVFFCCGDQYSLEVRNASSKKLYFLVGEPLRFRDDDERGEGSSLRSLPPDIRETIVLNRKINFLSVVSQLSNEWWLIHERNLQVDCAKVDGITVADADLHKGLRVPPEQLGHLAISTPLPP
mmetsp:Transcript_6130/g.20005  ORF Transcript_6130/g.20005 Transcript_6130/m.20005 type:complete len:141 (+) Transcript_6130:116-538(+)